MKAFFEEYFWGKRAYLTYWYAFLLSLPFSWRKVLIPSESGGSFNEYMDITLYIGDILMLFTLYIILKHEESRKSIYNIVKMLHVEQLIIALLLGYIILSIFWIQSVGLWLDGLTSLIRIFITFTIFIFSANHTENDGNCSTWNNIKYFTFLFSLILAFQSGLAILQFILNHSIGLSIIGESNIASYFPGIAKINIAEQSHIRSYGTFLHPNILAGYLVMGILFILVYIKKSQKLFHVEQLYYWLVIFVLILGLLSTFSKGAIVSLAIAIPLFLFHVEQKGHNSLEGNVNRKELSKKFKIWQLFHVEQLVFIGIIVTLAIVIYTTGQSDLKKSFNERIDIFHSYSVTMQEAVFGQGIGQGVYNLWKSNKNLALWQYQPIHNVYVLSLVELGIIGSGILTLLIISYIRKIVPRGTISWHIAPLLCLGTLAMFDHYLWDIYTGQILVALTLAWSYSLSQVNIDK